VVVVAGRLRGGSITTGEVVGLATDGVVKGRNCACTNARTGVRSRAGDLRGWSISGAHKLFLDLMV